MNLNEMMTAMQDAGMNGGSQLNMRSESAQVKVKKQTIPRLRTALKKKALLMFPTEIALPFNPATGQADETYNAEHKYRPPFSATTVALALKEMAQTNKALKEVLEKRAALADGEEWDTSDLTQITAQDWKIFRSYRVPRIFTLPGVKVQCPALNSRGYDTVYTVKVERDENLNVIGEKPMWMLANEFFRALAYEEQEEYKDKIAKGLVTATDKQQQEHISDIWKKVCVSSDQPQNYVVVYEIPIDEEGSIAKDAQLSSITADELKKFELMSNYKAGYRDAINKYISGTWKKLDKVFDFFPLQMECPTDGDDSTTQGKAEIGKSTSYERPIVEFNEENYGEQYTKFLEAARERADNDLHIENRVSQSTYMVLYDEQAEANFVRAIGTMIDLDSKYLTKKVIENHKDFLLIAKGDDAAEIIDDVEGNVSDKKEGALDEGKAQQAAKEYDLTSMEDSDAFADMDDELSGLDAVAQSIQ